MVLCQVDVLTIRFDHLDIKDITTGTVFTEGETALPRMNKLVSRADRSLVWRIIAEKSATAACISYQRQLE